MRVELNRNARRGMPYPQQQVLNLRAGAEAASMLKAWPGYRATPLRSLEKLARELRLGQILYKDESQRFGLKSFKALGGAYAVARLLQSTIARCIGVANVSIDELLGGAHADITSLVTVCCATDGNHGRSVAWGAQMFGCRSVIFLHERVSEAREAAIARFGARIIRTPGNYDDSVRAASDAAAAYGWLVVSDTSYSGYVDVPRDVMQGYSVLLAEAEEQWPAGTVPTHTFVQGGVGGLAASICGYFWERFESDRPLFVVVEPEAAACLYESARAGVPSVVHGDLDTVLAGLACGEVSLLAWKILEEGADAFMTIPDSAALDAMRLLADGQRDAPIVVGESGAAGLAGLIAAANDARLRRRLDLSETSSVFVIGTEGDTDAAFYEQVVGRSADQVLSAGRVG